MKLRVLIVALFVWGCGGSAPVEDETPVETQTAALEEEQQVNTEPERDPLEAPADVAAIPEDATVTASGLGYKVLQEPNPEGRQASQLAKVKVHYTGWTTDGERFDSSVERGESLDIELTKVIEGWKEGVGEMKEGEKRRFWIPENLAYKGAEGFPAGMLVFEVELIQVY